MRLYYLTGIMERRSDDLYSPIITITVVYYDGYGVLFDQSSITRGQL